MPRITYKVPVDGVDYYIEWSTIVDAPVTNGMMLEDFKDWVKDEYGNRGLEDFERYSLPQVKELTNRNIVGNRAGDKETTLTLDEIIQQYIIEPNKNELPPL